MITGAFEGFHKVYDVYCSKQTHEDAFYVILRRQRKWKMIVGSCQVPLTLRDCVKMTVRSSDSYTFRDTANKTHIYALLKHVVQCVFRLFHSNEPILIRK